MSDRLACPRCGHTDDEQEFDVLGACDDNVFCTQCSCEFDPLTGVEHPECDECWKQGVAPIERRMIEEYMARLNESDNKQGTLW